MLGKMHRMPFPKSESRTKGPGEIIHVDVCGPMESESVGGSRYFLLIKDDYSHFKTVYFLSHKSQVKEKVEEFLRYVKNNLNFNVKIFRSDNGLEMTNNDMQKMLKYYGIRHQTSVAYTPEQNGSAEREMRTIVEAARTMIHAKNLKKNLWAEAVNTAVYILNRSGTSPQSGKTPYEAWFGKKPEIKYFKIFGTEVSTHIPKEKRRKWDSKANNGIFVGYDENIKGYRVYYPERNKVEVCRDITFKNKSKVTTKEAKPNVSSKVNLKYKIKEEEVVKGGEKEKEEEIQDEENFINNDEFQKQIQEENEEENLTNDEESQEQVQEEENIMNNEEEGNNDNPSSERMKLRGKEKIKKPARYLDFAERIALIAENCEPLTYNEALESKEVDKWKAAMDEEMESLKQNETWELRNLPEDRKAISNNGFLK